MRCVVCGDTVLNQQVLACTGCAAPHHFECWAYAGRCARYACRCREAVPEIPEEPRAQRLESVPQPLPGAGILAGDWVHGWELRSPEKLARRVLLALAALLVLLRG